MTLTLVRYREIITSKDEMLEMTVRAADFFLEKLLFSEISSELLKDYIQGIVKGNVHQSIDIVFQNAESEIEILC